MPDQAWTAVVRTRMDRPIPATELPWMRAKEVWVHAVDLRAGLTFADLAPEFCAVLADEVLGHVRRPRGGAGRHGAATDVDRTWGSGVAPVRGPVAAIAAWLTRGDASGADRRGAGAARLALTRVGACVRSAAGAASAR